MPWRRADQQGIEGGRVAQTGVGVERECTGPGPQHLPPGSLPLRPGRLQSLRHGLFGAISEFPKGRKYLISLSFRGKASVRPAQVGGFDVNIVIHGSTAVRGRGDLVAYRWALWKLTAPWTHRTRPPHLGKRCAFSTSSTGPFPSNHSRKTPKGPKIALGNPDRPLFGCRTPRLPLPPGLGPSRGALRRHAPLAPPLLRSRLRLTASLGGGVPTQNSGCTLQGVDVRLEGLDLGVPGRDGVGDLAHGGNSTGGVGGVSTH